MPVITNSMRQPDQLPVMAKALDVNLEQAVIDGKIHNFQRHDAAFRCQKCSEKPACETWLANNRVGAAKTPNYCRNKVLLEELRIG
ncbi:DUF6455 family protein [Ruegeria lacuscaerulensis]|uniref:DUF6455 family protein n=1 Tax=Ruegeria lacuscaerulensis TaxID=55218 RepID=UPI00147AA057|nr:DUF6455 family protein [Ruegeria lacuscaerulensis]